MGVNISNCVAFYTVKFVWFHLKILLNDLFRIKVKMNMFVVLFVISFGVQSSFKGNGMH